MLATNSVLQNSVLAKDSKPEVAYQASWRLLSPLTQGRDPLAGDLGAGWGKIGGGSIFHVEDTAVLDKAGLADPQPCCSYSSPSFPRTPEVVWVCLGLFSSTHRWACQLLVEKGVCSGQQPNPQGAHASALGPWASWV